MRREKLCRHKSRTSLAPIQGRAGALVGRCTLKSSNKRRLGTPLKMSQKKHVFFMSFLGLGIFQKNLEFWVKIVLEFSKKSSPNRRPTRRPNGHFFRGSPSPSKSVPKIVHLLVQYSEGKERMIVDSAVSGKRSENEPPCCLA